MADSVKLSDIAAEMKGVATDEKDHFIDSVYGIGENESDPENGIPAMAEYMAEYDTPNEVDLTNIYVKSVLQPGGLKTASGKVFNVTADAVEFKARKASVKHIAMNYLFSQEDLITLKQSYLLAVRRKDIKADEIPFAEYIIADVMKKANEELRLAYYQAVHNAQGTNFLTLFDGLRKQILDAITSGEIPTANVVDTLVFSSTNAVAETKKIVKKIPTQFLSKVVCVCSREYKEMYEDDFLERYGNLPFNTGIKKAAIAGTSIPFMVEPGMDGFSRPIFTTKKNLARLHDLSSSKTDLTVNYDERERNIALVMDAQAGAGFGLGRHIWTANPE